MIKLDLKNFLISKGLTNKSVKFRKLEGGYTNHVWLAVTDTRQLVIKEFTQPVLGSLFPNLPEDEARALRVLEGLNVAPVLIGFWPEASVLIYEYVEGEMWEADVEAVANLILRKERADPTGFRSVPIRPDAILFQGDDLFRMCKNKPDKNKPMLENPLPYGKLSLIHTDIGGNLISGGNKLRLIDWQCPAAGDICEDIYSFLSPAFQILAQREPLKKDQIKKFWTAIERQDLKIRYDNIFSAYAWRFAGYCSWRSEVIKDVNISSRYKKAFEAELNYMGKET